MKKSYLMWAMAAMMGSALLCGCGEKAPEPPKPVEELTVEERHAEMEAAIEAIEARIHDETYSPGARREPLDQFLMRYEKYKDDPLYKQVVKKYGKMQIHP